MSKLFTDPTEYACAQNYGVRGTIAAIVPYSHIESANAELTALRTERDAFERDYTAVGERNAELHAMYMQRASEVEGLRAMLLRLEWLDMGHAYPICPVCEGHEHEGHAAGCELAALAATPAPDGRRDAGEGGG